MTHPFLQTIPQDRSFGFTSKDAAQFSHVAQSSLATNIVARNFAALNIRAGELVAYQAKIKAPTIALYTGRFTFFQLSDFGDAYTAYWGFFGRMEQQASLAMKLKFPFDIANIYMHARTSGLDGMYAFIPHVEYYDAAANMWTDYPGAPMPNNDVAVGSNTPGIFAVNTGFQFTLPLPANTEFKLRLEAVGSPVAAIRSNSTVYDVALYANIATD